MLDQSNICSFPLKQSSIVAMYAVGQNDDGFEGKVIFSWSWLTREI